jgi:nitric oxide reductase NorQ protein
VSRGDGPGGDDPLDGYRIRRAPYYRPVGGEVALFTAAYAARLPLILKGPTGCGKTRFIEHMAWRLGRPLVTLACHEDMTAADLVGCATCWIPRGRAGRTAR